jgi:hypothetical protein
MFKKSTVLKRGHQGLARYLAPNRGFSTASLAPMSSSSITLAGKTLWFNDEAFAFWLRVMALNLEKCPNDDYAWSSEVADDWMRTTRFGVGHPRGSGEWVN